VNIQTATCHTHFIFNGQSLPKWTPHWYLCTATDALGDYEKWWDEFIDQNHIWHLQCRLDHVGVVESEDPGIFQACAQGVLLHLLAHKENALKKIAECVTTTPSNEIYYELVEGLVRMLYLCRKCGYAFWTSGHPEDLNRLEDCIRCHKLAVTDPDYFEPPHLKQRRLELQRRIGHQLEQLSDLAQPGGMENSLRRLLNLMPRI